MSQPLSGPGVGLQLPQFLYPSELINAPYDVGTPQLTLAAGDQIPIPAGTWGVGLGLYCVLEWLDPMTNVWKQVASATWQSGLIYIKSDGFNFRVANRTGCPIAGVVTAPGNGSYVQATTSISVTGGGGSTWAPIIGGQLGGATITSYGAGYGVAPMVIIPPPPPVGVNANGVGGIPATGYAVIASGTVSGFTLTNPGAGYRGTLVQAIVVPNPTDPNISTGITNATVSFSVIGSGSLTGVLCTNPGAPLSTPANITLTVSGAGANATCSAVMMQTVTAASVVGQSTIVGASFAGITSTAGGYPTSTFTNSPEFLGLAGRPRPAQLNLTVGGIGTIAAQTGAIVDGGLFFSAPNPIVQTALIGAGSSVVGGSTLTFTMGSRPDIIILQPGP